MVAVLLDGISDALSEADSVCRDRDGAPLAYRFLFGFFTTDSDHSLTSVWLCHLSNPRVDGC